MKTTTIYLGEMGFTFRAIVPRHGLGSSIAVVAPTCTMATLFHDCFAGAGGVIALPGFAGPVDGWTYTSPKNGQITLTPGLMTLQSLGINNVPGASKALLLPLASISSTSLQVTFTEFPAPLTAKDYNFFASNTGSTEMVNIFLADNGFAGVFLGSTVSLDGYSGTWTPVGGATHKVDLSINGSNVPTLFIDNVAITLGFLGTGFSPTFTPPTNTASAQFNGANVVASGTITRFFVTSGVLPNTTVYCC